MSLFAVTDNDRRIYEEQIRDYLPDKIIDVHAHVWKGAPAPNPNAPKRIVSWPSLVAAENTIEDIQEAYKLYFPDKEVTPLIYADRISDLTSCRERNAYIAESVKATGFPALYYSHPLQTADELKREIYRHGYLGIKSYLSLSPSYIPEAEIYTAEIRYDKKGTNWLSFIGTLVLGLVVVLLLIQLMPDILQLVDNFISMVNPSKFVQ